MDQDTLALLGGLLDELVDLLGGLVLVVEEHLVLGVVPKECKVDNPN